MYTFFVGGGVSYNFYTRLKRIIRNEEPRKSKTLIIQDTQFSVYQNGILPTIRVGQDAQNAVSRY